MTFGNFKPTKSKSEPLQLPRIERAPKVLVPVADRKT